MSVGKLQSPLAMAALAAIAVAAPFSTATADTVVVADSFADGARSDGTDPMDANWFKNATGVTLGVTPDAGLGSDALRFVSTGGFTSAIAAFPTSVTLAGIGDFVDASFRFRMDAPLGSASIRFGLYDGLTTPAVDDNGLAAGTPPGSTSDDRGYYAILSGLAAGGHGLREEFGGTDRVMSGTDFALIGGSSLAGVTDTAVHTAAMRVTRTATGVNVAWSYGGNAYVSVNDTTPQTLTFNEFAYQVTGANKVSFLDDVVVTTNVPTTYDPVVVPLPAAAWGGLVLLGAVGATRLGRRRTADLAV